MMSKRIKIEFVIPVYNEELQLEGNVLRLYNYLTSQHFSVNWVWRIVIADNGSTDLTGKIGSAIARRNESVLYLMIPEKGRGLAISRSWVLSDADIVFYMDLDLSTELAAIPKAIDRIVKNGCDLVIGSRLLCGSVVERSVLREVLSRSYNFYAKLILRVAVSDLQCGFKAMRRDSFLKIQPNLSDRSWFFDTQLIFFAQTSGLMIFEIPVTWVEDPDSRVKVVRTVIEMLLKVPQLKWRSFRKKNKNPGLLHSNLS